MDDPVRKLAHEPHIFRLTLSFHANGTTSIVVVSEDGSIVYLMEATSDWLGEFKAGEHKIYVSGHYDLLDNHIYLGKRVPDPMDW
jgi:hypothetical protein